VGGPGSGKTRLARRLGGSLALPVVHLDDVARVGGGTGPIRSEDDRQADVARIAAGEGWIVEGVHLGWTSVLLDRAELVIWLDHVGPSVASRRIVSRFVRNAFAELRQRRGRERFFRMRDYLRHLRDLLAGVRETRVYYPSDGGGSVGPTRSETQEVMDLLERSGHEVVRCRSQRDVDRLAVRFAGDERVLSSPTAPPVPRPGDR